ncbi:hypothetical protein [Chromatium okenii]|jgi:hypothetical protein|uniref:hypothetical protein n=1 Tax=Chromatium okenii TaxID=61644 RepID=UPI0026EDF02E|nr:hypothetical protein [Chromatium okenii]MBV5310228.1 hypothetical protein [Chromatium okenii]
MAIKRWNTTAGVENIKEEKDNRFCIQYDSKDVGVEDTDGVIHEKDISFLRNVVMSRLSRITTIRDCIVLGYIDGNFDYSERKQVAQIAEYLNLSASDVDSVENWLKEFWAILEKGNILFEGQ